MELDRTATAGGHGHVASWLRWPAWNALDGSHAILAEAVAPEQRLCHAAVYGAQRLLLRQSRFPVRHLPDLGNRLGGKHELQRSTGRLPEALLARSGIPGRLYFLQVHD